MTDRAITTTFNEDDYAKLLQQAVAVIDASRLQIARQLNAVAISTYWEIGKLLTEEIKKSKLDDEQN